MLKRLGVSSTIVESGAAAVESVAHSDFDLILMDIQMPEMDGHEATRVLRKNGCSTPIIALTAHAMQGDKDLCLAAGMNDYITKPVGMDALRMILHKWFKSRDR
ncbi:MAG: response regulator [Verrucomicrobia bacterium]|nr:response regulator [Verrucomicrobiota bacterium]